MKQEIKKLFRHVQLALPGLLGFCQDLDAVQQKAIDQLGAAAVHLIGWAWQRRAILGPKTDKLVADFPPSWQPEAAAVLDAWDQAVRSSSAVENWQSILRTAQSQSIVIFPQICWRSWRSGTTIGWLPVGKTKDKARSYALAWPMRPQTGWWLWAIHLPLRHLDKHQDR